MQGNGLFGANDPITREQLAAMLYRFTQEQGYDVSIGENTNILSYKDVANLSEYAIPAMQWAVGAGIINGTGDGSTLPLQGQGSGDAERIILLCYSYKKDCSKTGSPFYMYGVFVQFALYLKQKGKTSRILLIGDCVG